MESQIKSVQETDVVPYLRKFNKGKKKVKKKFLDLLPEDDDYVMETCVEQIHGDSTLVN